MVRHKYLSCGKMSSTAYFDMAGPSGQQHQQTNMGSTQAANMRSKEMTEWQQQTGTILERDTSLLQNQLWTDCTVIVGQEAKVCISSSSVHAPAVCCVPQMYECHRLHLAKTSPKLASMLYTADNILDEETELRLPDIKPQTFAFILE